MVSICSLFLLSDALTSKFRNQNHVQAQERWKFFQNRLVHKQEEAVCEDAGLIFSMLRDFHEYLWLFSAGISGSTEDFPSL